MDEAKVEVYITPVDKPAPLTRKYTYMVSSKVSKSSSASNKFTNFLWSHWVNEETPE